MPDPLSDQILPNEVSDPSSPFLTVAITLGGHVYKEDLRSQATIHPDIAGLNQALVEGPGRYAWWAMLQVLAEDRFDTLKEILGNLEAERFGELSYPSTGGKPLSEAKIKYLLKLDPQLSAIREELRVAKRDQRAMKVGADTIRARKDSVIEICRNMRHEMDNKVSVAARNRLGKE